MSMPPRYAFITLEPGMSPRDLFINLSQYGDVKLLSRVSDVSSLFTDLVRELETTAGGPKTIYMPQPVSRPLKRPSTEPSGADQRPQPGSSCVPVVKLPRFGGSTDPAHPILATLGSAQSIPQQYPFEGEGVAPLQKAPKEEHDGAIIADNKSEKDDSSQFGGDPVSDENDSDEGSSSDDLIESHKQGMKKQPPRPSHLSTGKLARNATQAQCTICKIWVKITKSYDRLMSHVFMHTKKERFVCPIKGCEYSNKIESDVRIHASAHHQKRVNPIDNANEEQFQSQTWQVDRCAWAPRCFPDNFESAPGGEQLFMKVGDKAILKDVEKF